MESGFVQSIAVNVNPFVLNASIFNSLCVAVNERETGTERLFDSDHLLNWRVRKPLSEELGTDKRERDREREALIDIMVTRVLHWKKFC